MKPFLGMHLLMKKKIDMTKFSLSQIENFSKKLKQLDSIHTGE